MTDRELIESFLKAIDESPGLFRDTDMSGISSVTEPEKLVPAIKNYLNNHPLLWVKVKNCKPKYGLDINEIKNKKSL